MTAIYELKRMREKIQEKKMKCEKDIDRFIRSETFFHRYTISITALYAQIEMLDEMDSWLKSELRKAISMAEAEL